MKENSKYYPLPRLRKPEAPKRKVRKSKHKGLLFEMDGGVRRMLAVLAVLLAVMLYVNSQESAPTTTVSAEAVDTGEGFTDYEEDLFRGVEPEW